MAVTGKREAALDGEPERGSMKPVKIEVRLQEIMEKAGLDNRAGWRNLLNDTGLERRTVARLRTNKGASPTLTTVSIVCSWLCWKLSMPPEEIVARLLAPAPDRLWPAVAGHRKVNIYVGERLQRDSKGRLTPWLARYDAAAVSLFTRAVSSQADKPEVETIYLPSSFYSTPAGGGKGQLPSYDERQVRSACTPRAGTAALYLGSQMVNNSVEQFVAGLFGCEPFKASGRRQTPFFIVQRHALSDRQSCFGGVGHIPGVGPRAPGVYFETPDGKLSSFPWTRLERGAGVLILVRDPNRHWMQMACWGLSGYGTVAISNWVTDNGELILKEENTVKWGTREIIVCVCGFENEKTRTGDILPRNADPAFLSESVLRKYLAEGL